MIQKKYKFPIFFSGIMIMAISGILGSFGYLLMAEIGVVVGFAIFVFSIIG
jgi:hypothetical protein